MPNYLRRVDVQPTQPHAEGRRSYLVQTFEEDSLVELRVAINVFLIALPGVASGDVHLVDLEYQISGTGGNTKYTAMATFYFLGALIQQQLP